MIRVRLAGAASLLAALAFSMPFPALAFSVSPMHIEMGTLGRDGRTTITAVNHRGTQTGVDISVTEITLDENGAVVELGSGDDEFLVFPPQALIEPYGQQNFRLQWLGDPEIQASRSFLIAVSEVPQAATAPDDGSTSAAVSFALSFSVVVNVRPLEGEPDISVRSTRLTPENGTEVSVEAVFQNSSNVHGVLSRSDVTVDLYDASGKRLVRQRYGPSQMQIKIGVGLLPPDQSRTLKIPLSGISPEILDDVDSVGVSVVPTPR